jgi:hypothetical protein
MDHRMEIQHRYSASGERKVLAEQTRANGSVG